MQNKAQIWNNSSKTTFNEVQIMTSILSQQRVSMFEKKKKEKKYEQTEIIKTCTRNVQPCYDT